MAADEPRVAASELFARILKGVAIGNKPNRHILDA